MTIPTAVLTLRQSISSEISFRRSESDGKCAVTLIYSHGTALFECPLSRSIVKDIVEIVNPDKLICGSYRNVEVFTSPGVGLDGAIQTSFDRKKLEMNLSVSTKYSTDGFNVKWADVCILTVFLDQALGLMED